MANEHFLGLLAVLIAIVLGLLLKGRDWAMVATLAGAIAIAVVVVVTRDVTMAKLAEGAAFSTASVIFIAGMLYVLVMNWEDHQFVMSRRSRLVRTASRTALVAVATCALLMQWAAYVATGGV